MTEEVKKKQTRRYSDAELDIIKGAFAEQDDLIKALRKHFLQANMTAVDLSLVELIKKPEILKLVRKTFVPEIEGGAPLHQVVDLYLILPIQEKLQDIAIPTIKARVIMIAYLEQQMNALEGKKTRGKIKLSSLLPDKTKIDSDLFIDLLARNEIVKHVEAQLNFLLILAGMKEETLEQTLERLNKDSTK
jgi:hypothetical protein